MTANAPNKLAALVILDGWGIAPDGPGNAISLAKTQRFDQLIHNYPHTQLSTSGRDVGLRDGQMGNSEVGHLNIGAGFVVNQALTHIDLAIEDGSFFSNDALVAAMQSALDSQRPLHLLGLVSDGGVHSHIDHLIALIQMAKRQGISNLVIHAILDGRDTSPTGGTGYLQTVLDTCAEVGIGRVCSIVGRYYAMDRDKRWERTRVAFDLLVNGTGESTLDPIGTIKEHYRNDNTDEFMMPIAVGDDVSQTRIGPGDSVIFFNFRSDRPRQLSQALIGPDPDDADFSDRPAGIKLTTMLPHATFIDAPYAFEPVEVEHPLASVISQAGLRQFHTAETEKYAHVTYFINGGREKPFPGEDRKMIPSPHVATYDLQPEMSASGVADAAIDATQTGNYQLIIVNFANCDMVGHTGIIDATIKATEAVDTQLGKLVDSVLEHDGTLLIIADHGNAEQMLVPNTDAPMTAHTTNPVPCILVSPDSSPIRNAPMRDGGRLADVAPTILGILGVTCPAEMTGQSLIDA